jgi:hypothetical protein
MSSPAWLTGIFAVLMITVATYCAGRLVAAGRWRRLTEVDTDAGHVLMGVAMAGMLVARLRILPAVTWEVVFAVAAAWFASRLLQPRRRRAPTAVSWRCPHPAPHLVECAAMLFMFLALPASLAGRAAAAGMGGMATGATASRYSFLALLMALFMFGYVVRVADRLTPRTAALALAAASQAQPAVSAEAAPSAQAAPSAGAARSPQDKPTRPYLAPRCAALCKIAMGMTMGYMLVLML